MSMEMLKRIELEVGTLISLQRREESASRKLQEVRTKKTGWTETWDAMTSHWNGRNDRALEVLTGVLDELRHDILRIAELRLAASEREYKVKAAQRRAVLNACILPLPEGTSHDSLDILPALKGGDSHFTEASQCALTCTQDLQLLHGLTPPVRRPKHCGRRLCHGRGLIHIPDTPTHAR